MKILVTGSQGTVGSMLVCELVRRGHQVYGLDLYHKDTKNYIRCDIADYRQLEYVLKLADSPDIVYNCAAEFGRWNGEDYYETLWRSNVIGFKNILRLQENIDIH